MMLMKNILNYLYYTNYINYVGNIDKKRCSICLDDLDRDYDIVTTRCKHTFCFSCLLKHIKVDNKCPLCRDIICKKHIQQYNRLTIDYAISEIDDIIYSTDIENYKDSVLNFSNPLGIIKSMTKVFMLGISKRLIDYQINEDVDDDDDDDSDQSDDRL